jgi:hypothetical protein
MTSPPLTRDWHTEEKKNETMENAEVRGNKNLCMTDPGKIENRRKKENK